jgi:hypothetical protein
MYLLVLPKVAVAVYFPKQNNSPTPQYTHTQQTGYYVAVGSDRNEEHGKRFKVILSSHHQKKMPCADLFSFFYFLSQGIVKLGLETVCCVCFEVLHPLATLLLKKTP